MIPFENLAKRGIQTDDSGAFHTSFFHIVYEQTLKLIDQINKANKIYKWSLILILKTAHEIYCFSGGFDTFINNVYFDIICQKFSREILSQIKVIKSIVFVMILKYNFHIKNIIKGVIKSWNQSLSDCQKSWWAYLRLFRWLSLCLFCPAICQRMSRQEHLWISSPENGRR